MASIIKRGDVWYIKMYDASGKQRMIKGFTDKAQTKQLSYTLESEKDRIKRGDIDPQQEQQKAERKRAIDEHVTEYRSHLEAGGRSYNHIAYTIADIRAFIAFSGVKTLSTVTRAQVDTWVISIVAEDAAYRAWQEAGSKGSPKGSPNSARTINRRVGSLQAILKWAHSSGAVNQYVLSKYPKREVRGNAIRESRALDETEVVLLLQWCQTNAKERHDLYQFAILTGCRAEECAAMKAAHFDLKHHTLTVHSKDPRHSDRVDVVPLHPTIVELAKKLIKDKGDKCLFELPPMQAEQLRKDCQAAGIEPKGVTFHGLRHTFVTFLARKNVHPTITQKLARHRDIAMTLGYYTHWSTNDERAALALL